MEISFRKLTSEEFQRFAEWSIASCADDLLEAGAQTRDEALEQSRTELEEMLPDGLASKDNYLYVIQNSAREDVGLIWYQRHMYHPAAALIGELIINEPYRRQGYGRAALALAESDARSRGYTSMMLNVYKSNLPACGLYCSAGYAQAEDYGANWIMEKAL